MINNDDKIAINLLIYCGWPKERATEYIKVRRVIIDKIRRGY